VPWAGSAEREGGRPPGPRQELAWETRHSLPQASPSLPCLPRQQGHYLGEPANQIGQQAGDLCGVGTARVSVAVYPAVFFKTEISVLGTAAVSYRLWLKGLWGRLFQSADHRAWRVLKECALPRPVQVGKVKGGPRLISDHSL
jgi:hypothetical protein